jgi:hypothetical protein
VVLTTKIIPHIYPSVVLDKGLNNYKRRDVNMIRNLPKIMGFGRILSDIEFFYSLIVIAICLFIYFKTKEMYDLTGHKGIRFFRQTFLWLSIAYIVRFLILFNKITFNVMQKGSMHIALFLFVFASTMSLLYLAYSVVIKKWNFNEDFVFSLSAMVISLISVTGKNIDVFLLSQLLLFVFAVVFGFAKRHKLKGTYVVYILLFLFWLFGHAALKLPMFLFNIKVGLYLISVALFLLILHLVLKRLKNGKKR